MKHLILACALLLASPAIAEELVSAKSPHDVKTTLDQVEAAAKAQDFKVVARVDHSAAAKAAGLELRPSVLHGCDRLVFWAGWRRRPTPFLTRDAKRTSFRVS